MKVRFFLLAAAALVLGGCIYYPAPAGYPGGGYRSGPDYDNSPYYRPDDTRYDQGQYNQGDDYDGDDSYDRWDYYDTQLVDYGPSSNLTINFNTYLEPYGSWVNISSYGRCWVPRVQTGWRPYSYGHWIWTRYGWSWVAYEPWGWATHHYGRWDYDRRYGWCWIPGYTWGPAWVRWHRDRDYVCWAPLGHSGRRHSDDFFNDPDHWNGVRRSDFDSDDIHSRRASSRDLDRVIRGRSDRDSGPPDRRDIESASGHSIPETRVRERNVNGPNGRVRIVAAEGEDENVRGRRRGIESEVLDSPPRSNTPSGNRGRSDEGARSDNRNAPSAPNRGGDSVRLVPLDSSNQNAGRSTGRSGAGESQSPGEWRPLPNQAASGERPGNERPTDNAGRSTGNSGTGAPGANREEAQAGDPRNRPEPSSSRMRIDDQDFGRQSPGDTRVSEPAGRGGRDSAPAGQYVPSATQGPSRRPSMGNSTTTIEINSGPGGPVTRPRVGVSMDRGDRLPAGSSNATVYPPSRTTQNNRNASAGRSSGSQSSSAVRLVPVTPPTGNRGTPPSSAPSSGGNTGSSSRRGDSSSQNSQAQQDAESESGVQSGRSGRPG